MDIGCGVASAGVAATDCCRNYLAVDADSVQVAHAISRVALKIKNLHDKLKRGAKPAAADRSLEKYLKYGFLG